MITNQFYNNLTSNPTETDFYLTNGANKSLNKIGGGTTDAIAQINEEFFNFNNMKCIFNSNNLIKNNYSDQDLYLSISSCNNVGSTYYIEIKDNKYNNYNVIGVYHINGWRNPLDKEKTEIYKQLVSSYYIAILDHFSDNITQKKIDYQYYILSNVLVQFIKLLK
jgi:hypothetical protein